MEKFKFLITKLIFGNISGCIGLILVGFLTAQCQNDSKITLHLIVICDSNDSYLKEGFNMNLFHLSHLADSIAVHTGMTLNKMVFSGNRAHSDTIRLFLQNFKCAPNDVVLFQYSGHGINRNWTGDYPAFLLPPYEHLLSVEQIELYFAAKKPRLTILITDCCNHVVEEGFPQNLVGKLADGRTKNPELGARLPSPQNYKQLFLKSSGIVKITASQRGQVAYTHDSVGGILTTLFTDMLYQACQLKGTSTGWGNFIREVAQNTEETAFYFDKIQKPYFQIFIKSQ